MVCKILFFDYIDSEKNFFKKFPLDNYCIRFFEESINKNILSKISAEDMYEAAAISIGAESVISSEIIDNFKNLRVISVRSKNCNNVDLLACLNRNIAVVNIESYNPNNEFGNLKSVFSSITGILCGEKERRII